MYDYDKDYKRQVSMEITNYYNTIKSFFQLQKNEIYFIRETSIRLMTYEKIISQISETEKNVLTLEERINAINLKLFMSDEFLDFLYICYDIDKEITNLFELLSKVNQNIKPYKNKSILSKKINENDSNMFVNFQDVKNKQIFQNIENQQNMENKQSNKDDLNVQINKNDKNKKIKIEKKLSFRLDENKFNNNVLINNYQKINLIEKKPLDYNLSQEEKLQKLGILKTTPQNNQFKSS
jgi:hypothetical protein